MAENWEKIILKVQQSEETSAFPVVYRKNMQELKGEQNSGKLTLKTQSYVLLMLPHGKEVFGRMEKKIFKPSM